MRVLSGLSELSIKKEKPRKFMKQPKAEVRTRRNLPNKGRSDYRTRRGSILWKVEIDITEFANKGHLPVAIYTSICLPVDFMKTAKYSTCINRSYQ